MAGFGSLYSGIGLAQGLGGMSQAYAQGQQAAQQLAMQKIQQQMYLDQMQDSKLSRQVTLKNMQQKEQERQDALRRAEKESKAYASLFGSPTPKTPVKTPVDSLGAVTPSEGITNESLVPQEPTKTPSIIPLSAMGAIPQEKTPIKSELSALSMQPEVTQYETLKSQIQDIQSTLQDPNVSPEKKQEALRDFQYYAPQIPKVIDGYQNYAYKQISAVASNPTEGGLEKVKPFITALYPDIKNIILKKELIEGTKDQYQNKFLMKFQEGKNEYYIPVDPRSLMTMNDPKQQMDVVNKVENAREETLRAIAISDRQMKQMLSSQDNTIRANAQQLYLFELRAAPTVQRNTDPKTKAVQPLIPLFKTKYDLLVELEDKLLKEKGLEDNSKNRNIVIQDPEYKKLDNSLIDQTRK